MSPKTMTVTDLMHDLQNLVDTDPTAYDAEVFADTSISEAGILPVKGTVWYAGGGVKGQPSYILRLPAARHSKAKQKRLEKDRAQLLKLLDRLIN